MKAVILAAGKGNRLKPITDTTPKPLIKVQGKPILAHILENLPETISEVIIVINYKGQDIKDFFTTYQTDLTITFAEQTGELKGTMAALLAAQPYLLPTDRFLVLNSDDIHKKEELELYLQYDRAYGIQKMIMPGYHAVECDQNGIVVCHREPTEEEKTTGTPIATGVYVLDYTIFDFEPVVLRDGEIGLPQTILANVDSYPVFKVETQHWMPINNHEDLERAQNNIII